MRRQTRAINRFLASLEAGKGSESRGGRQDIAISVQRVGPNARSSGLNITTAAPNGRRNRAAVLGELRQGFGDRGSLRCGEPGSAKGFSSPLSRERGKR